MKTTGWLQLAILVCASSFVAAGCVTHRPALTAAVKAGDEEVEVADDPPPVIVEAVGPSPGVEYILIPGAWAWEGQWVWHRGYWERPPHPDAHWVPPQYYNRNGKHTFVHGGWK